MGLLSGLDIFGLGDLEKKEIYEKKEAKNSGKKEHTSIELKEEDFLFDKTYTCPICDNEFKTRTVRAGKARLLGTDLDLRPKYEGIDMIKYDTVLCPVCGYATLSRYFKFLTSAQSKLIRDNICVHYRGRKPDGETYTYDQALERYKLVLANAIVKHAKASEKAYICLKSAWLLRGMQEQLDQSEQSYLFKKATLEKQEKEYLQNALDGFLAARQSEAFPMCGMDESTVDYLIAVLAMNMEQFDLSMKIVGNMLGSPQVNSRTKDKVRDLKDILLSKMRDQKGRMDT